MKKIIISLVLISLLTSCSSIIKTYFKYESWKKKNSGQIVDVNLEVEDGILHYQVIGRGEPLLLLHGGFGSIDALMAEIPTLSKKYQLIVPDFRGHGKSIDLSKKPFTFKLYAKDIEAIIKNQNIDNINIIGISDGANCALQLSINKNIKINKMALLAPNSSPKQLSVEIKELICKNGSDSNLKKGPLPIGSIRKYYIAGSNKPEYWPTLYKNVTDLWLREPNFSNEELMSIECDTLLISGEHDEFIPYQYVESISQIIPKSNFVLIEGYGHEVSMENPLVVNNLYLDFFSK